jgi:predicted flap endonuclease-1-like 5' DNA nuclease
MTAPDWVQDALDGILDDGEELVDAEELESDKLAVASTPERGLLVRSRFLRAPQVHEFELEVPAGGPGIAAGPETTTEPLPDAAEPEAPEPEEEEEAEPEEHDEPEAAPEPQLSRLSGIGPKRQERLHEHGVEHLEDLLEVDAEDLAEELSVSVDMARAWHREVDLTGLGGIGPKRAERLRGAGVHTLTDLALLETEDLADLLDVSHDNAQSYKDEARQGLASVESLTEIPGIGPKRAQRLVDEGVDTLLALVRADPTELADAIGVGEGSAEDWQRAATEHVAPGLLDVSGIGPARARSLVREGVLVADDLVAADAEDLADRLGLATSRVESWQGDARAD